MEAESKEVNLKIESIFLFEKLRLNSQLNHWKAQKYNNILFSCKYSEPYERLGNYLAIS